MSKTAVAQEPIGYLVEYSSMGAGHKPVRLIPIVRETATLWVAELYRFPKRQYHRLATDEEVSAARQAIEAKQQKMEQLRKEIEGHNAKFARQHAIISRLLCHSVRDLEDIDLNLLEQLDKELDRVQKK